MSNRPARNSKMLPEHYTYLLTHIAPLAPQLRAYRVKLAQSDAIKDVDKRLRWDALYAAGLLSYLCETLYPYLNDDHVDAALRRIMVALNLNPNPNPV